MIELKISYYLSLTYLYRGQQSEDQQKWGERVTFYKAAHEKLENCMKLAKTFERTDVSMSTLPYHINRKLGIYYSSNNGAMCLYLLF